MALQQLHVANIAGLVTLGLLILYCNELDFVHICDLARYKFLKHVGLNCSFLNELCNIVESQFCLFRNLTVKYGLHGFCSDQLIRSFFREHFMDLVFVN